ncbi:MAG: hypothetical protein FWF15_03300 [Oscillospiraceae bacterium]|nr:hypothetical protein [Oscillospiraceae bacterium]
MILNSRQAAVAYRCPYCGINTISMVGIFSLSGDMFKLKCKCGKSELTITYTSDRKIRLNVPCLICPNSHNYVISSNTFFEKESFNLSCTYTSVEICFIGTHEVVMEELKKSDIELNNMLQEAGLDDFDFLKNELPLNDPQIEDIVRYMLVELDEEGKLKCECEHHGESMYDFEFRDNSVDIFCRTCGASQKIPMLSVTNANDFLHCDGLNLKKRSKKPKPPNV